LGVSADHSLCKSTKDVQCFESVDIRTSRFCENHRQKLYKQSLLRRQEFAVGTAGIREGPPTIKDPKVRERSIHQQCSFNLGGLTLQAQNFTVTVRPKPRPLEQQSSPKAM
jgi:hypothetical protein